MAGAAPFRHRWDVSIAEAKVLQNHAAAAIERDDRFDEPAVIAGVDVAYGRRGRSAEATAAAVLLDAGTLRVLDQVVIRMAVDFPYVPGLLTFREAPAAIAAVEALAQRPALLFCDGQGIAHPRRCGFASHLGLALDLPSIGVAKSRLVGTHADPAVEKGAWTPLIDGEETIGACLRTRTAVCPLYVSTGHRVSLPSAIRWVLRCTRRWRLPEPTHLADRLSKVRPSAPA